MRRTIDELSALRSGVSGVEELREKVVTLRFERVKGWLRPQEIVVLLWSEVFGAWGDQ